MPTTSFLRTAAVAAVAAALLPAVAPPIVQAAPLTLEQVADLAVRRSEAVRAGRAAETSANEAAQAAGQLPDPMLSAGIDNLPITGPDRFSTTRESMTMKRLGLSQEWLSTAKRDARRAAAQALAAREATAAQLAAGEARLQAALAYIDAYFAGQALQLAGIGGHHAREALDAARARLAAAATDSAEVLALAGARGLADDETAELQQQQNAARLALQRWIGEAIGETLDELAAPAITRAAPPDFVERHPAVLGARRELELARSEAAVAQAERSPNWTWEVAVGQRTGMSDLVSVGVSIPLPIARAQRQDRETASRLALVNRAEAMLAEATRMAAAEHQTLAADGQRLAARIERYQSGVLLPARQRTAAALAGYRSNQGSLAALLEARHAELEAQRRLLTLQKELVRTQAQLAFRPVAEGVAR